MEITSEETETQGSLKMCPLRMTANFKTQSLLYY